MRLHNNTNKILRTVSSCFRGNTEHFSWLWMTPELFQAWDQGDVQTMVFQRENLHQEKRKPSCNWKIYSSSIIRKNYYKCILCIVVGPPCANKVPDWPPKSNFLLQSHICSFLCRCGGEIKEVGVLTSTDSAPSDCYLFLNMK